MDRTIERGRTLLVDGPASVVITSGKAEVFGYPVVDTRRFIIREGKRLPFEVTETAQVGLRLGEKAGFKEVEGSTIPPSWFNAYETLQSIQKDTPTVVMVTGAVDSGKSSFCTFLINRLVKEKRKVVILDEDLGQSDVGAPSTVAYTQVTQPVTDLFKLDVENAFFVGATSPSRAADKTVEGTKQLRDEIFGKDLAEVLVVNTDGWVEGEEALRFKTRLSMMLEPDMVFCLQRADELSPLCSAIGDLRQQYVESPVAALDRGKENRKDLRELSYTRYLENSKLHTFPKSHITIQQEKRVPKGQEQGLLMGLYGKTKKFLGIGILQDIDYTRNSLKILTAVTAKPALVVFGETRLDGNLRELPKKTVD
ncbi:MAG: Clp1/GlmU family protein [Candidatus Bathyarchaeota archaeon]|nr:Clp1/GlmU family protein [Candidatus Bathyarchaeota archaeon]